MATQEPTLHLDQPVLSAGAPLETARLAVILLHGRGASAEDILTLADELALPDVTYFAPQAAGSTWYPYPFLVPTSQNEPWLSSALESVERCVQQAAGKPLALLGFSQGACLALEYAARRPRRYAALIGLSGGLIGSDAEITAREQALQSAAQPAGFNGTPAFLGCSDVDPHIPAERVRRSAQILGQMGAKVTARLYSDMGHTVNMDEIEAARRMLGGVL